MIALFIAGLISLTCAMVLFPYSNNNIETFFALPHDTLAWIFLALGLIEISPQMFDWIDNSITDYRLSKEEKTRRRTEYD